MNSVLLAKKKDNILSNIFRTKDISKISNKYYYKYIEWNQTYRIIKKRSNYEIISYYKGFNYKRIIKSLNDVQIDINLTNNLVRNIETPKFKYFKIGNILYKYNYLYISDIDLTFYTRKINYCKYYYKSWEDLHNDVHSLVIIHIFRLTKKIYIKYINHTYKSCNYKLYLFNYYNFSYFTKFIYMF